MITPSSGPSALSLPLRTPRVAERVPICPPADVSPRFTTDGDIALERFLAHTCDKIAAAVRGLLPPRKLEAMLLGGGYGRGEGGVLRTPAGERPYNDLEFYVCLRGNRHVNERRFHRALHVLGEILTPQTGVEVEFKITSLRELERSAVSMFSYDLIMGHRWRIGNEGQLARCAHHRDAAQIPLAEATRLLMNRGSGLLFAKERLEKREFTAADADFVRRNIAKAQLALGDALLVAHAHYHWSVRERHERLHRLSPIQSMEGLHTIQEHHAMGTEFKLHPERSTASREELLAQHGPLTGLAGKVWLWIEGRRLACEFSSAREYALSSCNKLPETGLVRNVFINLKTLGAQPFFAWRGHRHPRERILNAMALLLWEPEALTAPPLVAMLQQALQTEATGFAEMMDAYRRLWSQVN